MPDEPVCFGCSHGEIGGRRRKPRARWLVGDRQGHVTLECDRHAVMILSVGGSFAIPLASLCVVTDADELAELLAQPRVTDLPKTPAKQGCPTYVHGFTLDLERR